MLLWLATSSIDRAGGGHYDSLRCPRNFWFLSVWIACKIPPADCDVGFLSCVCALTEYLCVLFAEVTVARGGLSERAQCFEEPPKRWALTLALGFSIGGPQSICPIL